MAVANPQDPNLSSSYANVINALKSQTQEVQNTPPSALGDIAKVAGVAAGGYAGKNIADNMAVQKQQQLSDVELAKQKELLTFQNKLQTDLETNKEKYQLQAAGKVPFDQQGVNDYFQKHGMDPKFAPTISGTIYVNPKEFDNSIKHATFQTKVQQAADFYSQSKDPEDQRRGKLLGIISDLPDEKLDSVTDDLRKIILPESDIKKSAGTFSTVLDNNTGLSHRINSTTGEDQVLFAPKNRPTDQLITKTEHLYPAEKKAIEKAKIVTATQAKPIVDSLTKADTLINDINDNNPNTLTNIRAELGQLAGIPGSRMGFQMMQQEGINPGLANRVEQALVRASGNKALSAENKKDILEYVNSRKQQKISQLNGVIEDQANGLSLPDVHPDFLKSELGKGYSRYLNNNDLVNVISPQGVAGTIKRSKLDAAQKAGYKLAN